MTVTTTKSAINIREELADLRRQKPYEEQQFWMEGLIVNPSFDSSVGWTLKSNTSISGGQLTIDTTIDGSFYANAQSTLTRRIEAGRQYYYSIDVQSISPADQLFFQVGGGGPSTADLISVNTTGVTSGFHTAVAPTDKALIEDRHSTQATHVVNSLYIYEADGSGNVVHRMPKGWVPKDVFEDGLLQREGSANDYEVVYDGFDYFVKPTVAPSATTQTCVIGVRK